MLLEDLKNQEGAPVGQAFVDEVVKAYHEQNLGLEGANPADS